MSTRATYRFADRLDGYCNLDWEHTVYCHHDGMPIMAAYRLYRMVGAMTSADATGIRTAKGGYAYAFIRANGDAEPTWNHDDHGDTQYRYDIAPGTEGFPILQVRERKPDGGDGQFWHVTYEGSLAKFVRMHDKYLDGDDLIECRVPYGPPYLVTLSMARKIVWHLRELGSAQEWRGFPGNAKSFREAADAFVLAIRAQGHPMTDPATDLARAYHASIRAALTPGEREKADWLRHSGIGNEHDFLDANMNMLEAWQTIFGKEPDLEDEKTTRLLNAAAAAAARQGFNNEWETD